MDRAYIQINAAHSPKGRIHKTTLKAAEQPSPPSPWMMGKSPKRRSSDTEYGALELTPRRKRVIELKGALADSVLNQLRTAWAGAWFALQLDHAWEQQKLERYLSHRLRRPQTSKKRRGEVSSRLTKLGDPLLPGSSRLYSSAGSESDCSEGKEGAGDRLKVTKRKKDYDPRLGSAGFIFVLVSLS
jgi:hypothetical protein